MNNLTKNIKYKGIPAELNFTNHLKIVPLKPYQINSHLQAIGKTCVFKMQAKICPVMAGLMLRTLILHSDLSSFLLQRHCSAVIDGCSLLDLTVGLLLDFPTLKS